MAVSRFDFVPQQEVRQTYVPLPFESLMQAGRQKQADYDLALAQDQANQNMLKIQALPQDIETRNKIIKQYQDEIASKIDEVKGDYSQLIPFARQQAKKIEQDRTYGQLGAIQQNYNTAQASIKDVDERRSKGIIQERGYGLNRNSIQGFRGTQDLGGGRYTQLQPYNPVKSYAIAEEASKFAQTIKDSDLSGLQVDKALAGQYNIFRSSKGVPYNKAHLATAQYIVNNQEAVSNIKEELLANGLEPTNESILKRALEYADAPAKAAARTISDRDIKSDADYEEASKNRKSTDPPSIVDLGDIPFDSFSDLTKYQVKAPKAVEDQIFETKTKLAAGGSYMQKDEEEALRSDLIAKDKNLSLKLTKEQQNIIPKAEKALGIAVDKNDKQAVAGLINNYLSKLAKQSVSNTIEEITDKDVRSNENNFLFGKGEKGGLGVTERSIKLIDGEGPKEGRGTDLLKKYGDDKKYDIIVSGKLNPGNPFFEAGRIVKVVEKDGTPVARYAISGNYSEKEQNRVAHTFYQTKYKPDGKSTINLGGKDYTIDFENISSSTLADDGSPIKVGERASLLDKNGNVLRTIESQGDAIGELYESLRKK